MRSAQVERFWAKATADARPLSMSLRTSSKHPLADHELDLPPGLTVVCGLNGVGKSTLLRLVEGTLNGVDEIRTRCRPDLLESGEFEVRVRHTGSEEIQLSLGSTEDEGVLVSSIDAFRLCSQILSLSNDANFKDLIDGVQARELEGDELSLARFVTSKSYESVRVFEFERPTPLEGPSDEVLPFIQVSCGGIDYDSFSMGMGELAALMSLWALLSTEAGSIVLIEEPESFLSSKSTVSMLDVLARQIARRNLYGIVTTHSVDLISRIPVANLVLLQPRLADGRIEFFQPESRAEALHLLGAASGESRLIFTEDRMAARLTRELLAQGHGVWGRSVLVMEAGDESTVRLLCERLPKDARVRVVGVLDGDQAVTDNDERWPILVLPGPDNPDFMLRAAALSLPTTFADLLGRDHTVVATALNSVAGADEHDWFPDLAAELNLHEVMVFHAATECWLRSETTATAAARFVHDLIAAIGT